jgi:hypothetical protein
MDEDWRHVVGFENRYLVSDHGRVWSVVSAQFLKPYTSDSSCPYLRVYLYHENGDVRQPYVHTLVTWAFHGPPPSDTCQIHHKNGKPQDNCASNLIWMEMEDHSAHHNGNGMEEEDEALIPEKEAPF